tara:strand:+ start:3940 stop:5667 length:1728 start_codon:yes stop_codon:yes gene_type:complete
MRLIRLTTEDEKAQFDNEFTSDIKIGKNTQVGLQNITFEISNNPLVMNDSNCRIKYFLEDNPAGTPAPSYPNILNQLTYTDANFQNLLGDLNLKLNRKLSEEVVNALVNTKRPSLNALGKMWAVGLKDRKVSIECKTGGYNFNAGDWTIPSVADGNTYDSGIKITNGIIRNTDNTQTGTILGQRNIIYNSDQCFGKGFACASITITAYSDNGTGDQGGFIFGFTDRKPSDWGNYTSRQLQTQDIKYAIASQTGQAGGMGNYRIKLPQAQGGLFIDNVSGQSPINVQVGSTDPDECDTISFQILDGKLKGYLTQNSNDGSAQPMRTHCIYGSGVGQDVDLPIDYNEELYCFLQIQGKDDQLHIERFQITLDPFKKSKNNTFSTDEHLNFVNTGLATDPALVPANHSASPNRFYPLNADFGFFTGGKHLSFQRLEFTKEKEEQSVSSYLGYDVNILDSRTFDRLQTGLTTGFEFIANKVMPPLNLMDSYILEIQGGIPLEAYDGFSNNRKNIVAVIPNGFNDRVIVYETENINFVNFQNTQEQVIRNLRARILNDRLEPIRTTGLVQATLLLREGTE